MGCAASSSSSAAESDRRTENPNIKARAYASCESEHKQGADDDSSNSCHRRSAQNSKNGGRSNGDGMYAAATHTDGCDSHSACAWKDPTMTPVMNSMEREELIQLITAAFRTCREVLATIGRIKSTMRRWLREIRERIRARHEVDQQRGGDTKQQQQQQQLALVRGESPEREDASALATEGGDAEHTVQTSTEDKPEENGDDADADADERNNNIGRNGSSAGQAPFFINTNMSLDREGNVRRQSLSQSINSQLSPTTAAALSHRSSREKWLDAGFRLMHDRMTNFGMSLHRMPDDGNCQFRALAHQIYGDPERHEAVRQRICSAMREVKSSDYDFLFESPEECDEYMTLMELDGTYGDELTLRAACDAYGIAVHLLTSDESNYYMKYIPNVATMDVDEYEEFLDVFVTLVRPLHYSSLLVPPKNKK